MSRKPAEMPYVENYPPLRDFLREIDARCDWQLPLGDDHRGPGSIRSAGEGVQQYVEQWRTPNGRTMIVTVRANKNGWDIATPCDSQSIVETLADVRRRLGLVSS